MADSTSSSIEIDAPPGDVLDVIAEFAAYPEWAEQIKDATVLAEDGDGWADQVRFVMDAGPINDTYVLEYDWDGIVEDGSGVMRWHLVRAEKVLKDLHGVYHLDQAGERTRVTYQLEVALKIPMIGLLKRKAEKIIVDTALKELKRRVEAGVA